MGDPMRAFLLDYWWLILGALLAATFALVRRRGAEPRSSGTLPTVSFAAVRAYSVSELRPFFGVYLPTWREHLGYLVLVAWFGGMTALVVYTNEVPAWVVWLAAIGAALVAGLAAYVDARSRRVLGPDRIAFISPVPFFSWVVPLSEVVQCDLVPGQPYNRLRVVSRSATRSLPVPLNLWNALNTGSPN